jgi:hypothetical protein
MIRHAAVVIFSNSKTIHVLLSQAVSFTDGKKLERNMFVASISFFARSPYWHEPLAPCEPARGMLPNSVLGAAFVSLHVLVDSPRQIAVMMLRIWSAQA